MEFWAAAWGIQARYDCAFRFSGLNPELRMTGRIQYSYLASVPLLVVFSVATTAIKFREGMTVLQFCRGVVGQSS